jgi:hypothetical protein
VALCAAPAACTDAGKPLVVLQNQVVGDGCTISATPSSVFQGRGTVDLASDSGYLLTPVVQNVAEGERDRPALRLVQLRGVDVDVSFVHDIPTASLDTNDLAFTEPFSGTVEPGGTVAFGAVVIRGHLLDGIADLNILTDPEQVITAIATITVFGDMGGSSVESEPFSYPIDICNGCLQFDVGPCSALPTNFLGEGFACFGFIQDALHECCTDANMNVICPARGPAGAQ